MKQEPEVCDKVLIVGFVVAKKVDPDYPEPWLEIKLDYTLPKGGLDFDDMVIRGRLNDAVFVVTRRST